VRPAAHIQQKLTQVPPPGLFLISHTRLQSLDNLKDWDFVFEKKRDNVCQSNFDAFLSRNINVYHLVAKHHIFEVIQIFKKV